MNSKLLTHKHPKPPSKVRGNAYIGGEMVEVIPYPIGSNGKTSQDWYLITRSTLQRIGKPYPRKVLEQSIFVLRYGAKFYLAHANEIKWAEGEDVQIIREDIDMRNTVLIKLLMWDGLAVSNETWERIKEESPDIVELGSDNKMYIIPNKDKDKWEFKPLWTPRAITK